MSTETKDVTNTEKPLGAPAITLVAPCSPVTWYVGAEKLARCYFPPLYGQLCGDRKDKVPSAHSPEPWAMPNEFTDYSRAKDADIGQVTGDGRKPPPHLITSLPPNVFVFPVTERTSQVVPSKCNPTLWVRHADSLLFSLPPPYSAPTSSIRHLSPRWEGQRAHREFLLCVWGLLGKTPGLWVSQRLLLCHCPSRSLLCQEKLLFQGKWNLFPSEKVGTEFHLLFKELI